MLISYNPLQDCKKNSLFIGCVLVDGSTEQRGGIDGKGNAGREGRERGGRERKRKSGEGEVAEKEGEGQIITYKSLTCQVLLFHLLSKSGSCLPVMI